MNFFKIIVLALSLGFLDSCGSSNESRNSKETCLEIVDNPDKPVDASRIGREILRELGYPEDLRRRGVQGYFKSLITVNSQGWVVDAEIIQSLELNYDSQVLRKLKRAKLIPATKNGVPVCSNYLFTLGFEIQ